MVDHEHEHSGSESFVEKIRDAGDNFVEKMKDKVGHKHSSSSSSSDSDGDCYKSTSAAPAKSNSHRLFGREKPVHKVLGGGKPADIILWRKKKLSAGILGSVTSMWILFDLMEYHMITLICHTLILGLSALFLWSNASGFISRDPPKIPDVKINEQCVVQAVSMLGVEVNRGLNVMRKISSGGDVKRFIGTVVSLWVVSVIGKWFSLVTMSYLAVMLLFTVPRFYEKYENQVDAYGQRAMVEMKKQYAVIEKNYLSKVTKGTLKKE